MKPLTALAVAGGAVLLVRAYNAQAGAGRAGALPRETSTPRVLPERAQLALDRLLAEADAALRGLSGAGTAPAIALDASGRPFSGFLALADQGVQRPFLGGGGQNDVVATRVGTPNRGAVVPAIAVLPAATAGFATRGFDPGSGAFFPVERGGDADAPAAPSDVPSDAPTTSAGFSVDQGTISNAANVGTGIAGVVIGALTANPVAIIAGLANLGRGVVGFASTTPADAQVPSHALSDPTAVAFAAQRASERAPEDTGPVAAPAPSEAVSNENEGAVGTGTGNEAVSNEGEGAVGTGAIGDTGNEGEGAVGTGAGAVGDTGNAGEGAVGTGDGGAPGDGGGGGNGDGDGGDF